MGIRAKRILAAVDRSKYKEKIIEYAISLGKAWEAEIVAIHVIDPGHGIPGGRIKEKELERKEQALKPAQELLDEIELLAVKNPLKVEHELTVANHLRE